MNISAVSSSLASAALTSVNRQESANEGVKPDGDGDKDDVVQALSSVQPTSSGTVGGTINVQA